jgi:hypothetical protein
MVWGSSAIRKPYIHPYSGEGIRCFMPASGMTVALDP